jgi:uncharacterized protein (TIGR03437 family)
VGGGMSDFVAQSSGTIQTAVGSFPSVFGVTSESIARYGANYFSLQLNSNTFFSSLCDGCLGWEQFLFVNDPGGHSGILIEYWLINAANAASCPTGWRYFPGSPDAGKGCFLNSHAALLDPVRWPHGMTIQDLGNLALIGEAGVQGMDVVVLYTEPGGGTGAQIDASGQDSVLGLADSWNTAEFNVFGPGDAYQAIFNFGTTIVVQLSINDGTTNAPTCGLGVSTAETNSLTLMPETPWPTCFSFYGENAGGSPLPSIEFLESNYGPEAISVTATSPSSVTPGSAVLNGEVNPNGTEALAWFEYSTNSTPTCNVLQNAFPAPTPAFNAGSGTAYVPLSATLAALRPNTTYYYWACALGAMYQANSNVESFVTPTPPPPVIASVGNGASFGQSFAPGMLISVFGTDLSTDNPQANSTVPLPFASYSGTFVTINGIPAPLMYISATQINLQIPYEVSLGAATLVVYFGGQSASANFTIEAAAPGIFVDPKTGHIVPNESASPGAMIEFFLTGAGQVMPSEATGNVPAPGTAPAPVQPLTMTIGGIAVTPLYAGIPDWSVGVLQINCTVPSTLTAGTYPVVVTIGGVASEPGMLTVLP